MADLTSNLIVRLIDGVSAPARAAGQAIRGMRDSVAAASGRIATAQTNVRAAVEANAQRMDAMRGRMFGAAAGAYVLTKAISAPISAAMDFESAMADVRKVVDFDTPAAFKAFQTDIIGLSKRIPIAAKDLTSIAAAAGQAGIPRDELLRFTEMAAKVGVAFDISADQAGESLAKMMTGLGLSIDQVSALSDAMNHLSNNQASSASGILDVVRRVGASAKQYGFSATEVSAFASAMLAAGAESEVAATSFRNMGKALTKGSSATDRQAGALQTLGLDATAVAKRMQEDAVGTTMDVLERIGKLPAEVQAAVSSDIFGDEARALGPLLTNLDLLRKSLGLVSDESKYLGSAQREYEERAKTAANNLQRFRNQITAASIAIGNALLPGLTATLDALRPFVEAVERLATDFPELTSGVVAVTAGLMGLRLAAIGAGYAGLLLKGGLLTALVPALGLAKGMTRVAASLTRVVPRVGRFSKAMKAVPELTAATAAGMSLVDQSMTKAVKASKKASDAMVLGMSATRVAQAQASRSMIAGMTAVTAASVVPRRGFATAFKGVGTAAAAAIAAPVAAALRGLPAIARVAATGIKIALLGTGIGAALLVIGSALEWVRENWEGITVAVEAFSGEFNRSMAEAFPAGEPGFVQFIRDFVEAFDTLTGKIDPDNGKWAQWGLAAAKNVSEWATAINTLTNAFNGLGTAISDFYGYYKAFTDLLPEHFTIVGLAIETFRSLGRSATNVAAYFSGVTGAAMAATAEFFTAGGQWVQSLWDGMVAKVSELVAWAAKIPGRITAAVSSIDLSNIFQWPTMPAWLETIGETIGGAVQAVVDGGVVIGEAVAGWGRAAGAFASRLAALPSEVIAAFAGLASALAAKGAEAIQGLLDGMRGKVADLIKWVATIPGMIADAIGSIDLSGIIKWPSPPAWLGGAIGAGKASPSVSGASELPEARARGGPVRAGEEYLVGEEGPELFRPRRSGEIVPNGAFEPPEEVYRSLRPASAGQEASRSLSIGDIIVHVTGVNVERPADVGRQIGEAIRRRLDGEFADVFG